MDRCGNADGLLRLASRHAHSHLCKPVSAFDSVYEERTDRQSGRVLADPERDVQVV